MPRPRPDRAAPCRRRRRSALLPALVLVLAACGTTTTSSPSPSVSPTPAATTVPTASAPASPTTAPSQDSAAIYRTIEDQVVALRQLQPKAPVSPTVLDEAGIKKFIADSFSKDNPDAVVAANERIYKAFGLLPADASLKTLYVELLGSQVAGLYSPDDKKLFVVSKTGTLGAIEKTTFSHEFTHALQDQNFDLGSLKLDEIGESDRSLARLSLVEGDATLSMSYWQLANLTPAELGELVNASSNDESTKVLLAMPAILRESLLFPYIQGLSFVQGLQLAGGWQAVDDAFGRPPASTEQILHPDKYAANERPLAADLPKDLLKRLGAGWKIALQDTFGEFQLAVWLRQDHGTSTAQANEAAAGWGGDRIALVEGPNGAWGIVYRTVWDTAADAAAFESAASDYVASLSAPAGLIPGDGRDRWILFGSDTDTLHFLASALSLGG